MTFSVTICIPAYNARRYLPATLASVRAQTFRNWKLIVTEDGSAEPIEDLVLDFAKTVVQSVTYQRHEKNLGLPATRNTGIAAAPDEWIALLDSDDLWTPEHLANLVAFAQHRLRVDFVHSGSVLFDSESGREIEIRAPLPRVVQDYPASLYRGDYIVQPSSVLLKKSLWARVGGFNPAYRYVEDREMWLHCARAGAVFAFTGTHTCLYRKHGGALTTHASAMAEASAQVFDQHLDWPVVAWTQRRRLTAGAWMAAGRISLRSAPFQARAHFARAWRISLSPRAAAYWLAALFFESSQTAPSSPPSRPSMFHLLHRCMPSFLQPRALLRRRLEHATQNSVVLAGPFAGLKYVGEAIGSMWWPKILGTYERELAPTIETFCHEAPPRIIDVGAAEGYYAVGFAWRCPQSEVISFEGEASGRALQHSLAELNAVAPRISIRGFCDPDQLHAALEGAAGGLIICDIEGGELDLLNPTLIPALATGKWKFLIEIHAHVHPDITRTLRERFRATHSAEEIPTVPRRSPDLPNVARFTGFDRWTAPYLDERRPGPMSWLILRPKN